MAVLETSYSKVVEISSADKIGLWVNKFISTFFTFCFVPKNRQDLVRGEFISGGWAMTQCKTISSGSLRRTQLC